eukprot:PhM_4_TR16033/c0_g1_i1/m.103282
MYHLKQRNMYHATASRAITLMGIAFDLDIAISTTTQCLHSFFVPLHPALEVLSYCVDTTQVHLYTIAGSKIAPLQHDQQHNHHHGLFAFPDEGYLKTVLKPPPLRLVSNMTSIEFLAPIKNKDYYPIRVGDYMFQNCTSLRHVDVSNLTTLREIGKDFLLRSTVESVDVSGFCKVTSIMANFLASCSNLHHHVDLSSLTRLCTIDRGFLFDCRALESIDLSGLYNVRSIGNKFMAECHNLRHVDLSCHSLTKLHTIGDNFLSCCMVLESVDLSGLFNVTSVENSFLRNCWAMTHVDLSAMTSLQAAGRYFLEGNTAMQSVDLSGLKNVQRVDDSFLGGCKALRRVDLSLMTAVHSIENDVLRDCASVEFVDMSGLRGLTSLGSFFMSGCSNLQEIIFPTNSGGGLQSISKHFMSHCGLSDFPLCCFLSNVTRVGDGFLFSCTRLTHVDLSAMTAVREIGDYFLSDNEKLKFVDLSGLCNVSRVGRCFLEGASPVWDVNL